MVVPDPRAGRQAGPVNEDQAVTDGLVPPALPAGYQKPTPFGCMAVLLSCVGLVIGPLSIFAMAMGLHVALTCIADRRHPPFGAAVGLALGMVGEILFATHFPSVVNWTVWP